MFSNRYITLSIPHFGHLLAGLLLRAVSLCPAGLRVAR
jgi:hypothetical protein